MSVSLADPQSAKQTNVILMKERNGQSNAIFQGGELSASLSASLADPQSAKKTYVILIKQRNGQSNAILEGEKLSVSLSVERITR